jgi:hypothetical protein
MVSDNAVNKFTMKSDVKWNELTRNKAKNGKLKEVELTETKLLMTT